MLETLNVPSLILQATEYGPFRLARFPYFGIKYIYVSYPFHMENIRGLCMKAMRMGSPERRELLTLLMELEGNSKAEATALINSLNPDGQRAYLVRYRNEKNQRPRASHSPQYSTTSNGGPAATTKRTRPKMVPYSVLIPEEHLEELRIRSESQYVSVSALIRQGISEVLKKRFIL
jgi:hypothetical protein